MAKKFVSKNTLAAFMDIVKTALATKVSASDIANNLESDSDSEVLAASQGKALKEMIDALGGEDGVVAKAKDAEKLGGKGPEDYVQVADLLKSLEEYDAETDAEKAVAGELANALKEAIDALDAKSDDYIQKGAIVSDWSTYEEEEDTDGVVHVVAAKLIKALDAKVTSVMEYAQTAEDVQEAIEEAIDEAVTNKLGQNSGIATLDAAGKVPSSQLPSYVDDVVEGYLDAGEFYVPLTEDADFEEDKEDDEKFEKLDPPEKGKIYVDLGSDLTYRWSGSRFVEISSNDMVEIGATEVEQMWQEVITAANSPE